MRFLRKLILLASLFAIPVGFKSGFEDLVNFIFVHPFFSYLETNRIVDTVFILINFLLLYYTFQKVSVKYKIGWLFILSIFLSLAYYIYYRHWDDPPSWSFTRFQSNPTFAYTDSFYVFAFCFLIIYINSLANIRLLFNKIGAKTINRILIWLKILNTFFLDLIDRSKSISVSQKSVLLEDNPWRLGKEDLLGRLPAAKRIAQYIHDSSAQKAISIGIVSKWGDGKTSFLQMIKSELISKARANEIVLEFNPWFSKTPKRIIIDFFEVFEKKLGNYKLNLSRRVKKYADSLSSIKGHMLTRAINDIYFLFEGNKTINEEYGELNNELIELNKKIIVIIDDLDRLDNKEIIEVLKLIRNSANFHNTFFLVAFDKEYLKSAVMSINDYKSETYLEKIFQLEITPPGFDNRILKEQMEKLLLERFPEKLNDIRSAIYSDLPADQAFIAAFSNDVSEYNLFDFYIKNLRDVIRFVNLFTINYTLVEDEVLFKEFYQVQLLRLKFGKVVEEISKNEAKYFKTTLVDGKQRQELL